MELVLIVVLVVAVLAAWVGYRLFSGKKSAEVKQEPEAPYKLEPRTTIDSDFKWPKSVEQTQPKTEPVVETKAAVVSTVTETKSPELKVVTGTKTKKPAAKKSAGKPRTSRAKTAGTAKKPAATKLTTK